VPFWAAMCSALERSTSRSGGSCGVLMSP
jgi:hypothetical protein